MRRYTRLIHATRRQAAAEIELSRREPDVIPHALGSYRDTTTRELAARRLALELHLPPVWLARLGWLIPGTERRQIWFGFVTRLSFWRGARDAAAPGEWRSLTRGVPVLGYHAFAPTGDASRYVISRKRFRRQMRAIALLRYQVIGLEELTDCLVAHRLPERRSVVLTIDDGYRDNLTIAQPILHRRGFPATLFAVSAMLGAGNLWDRDGELAGRPILSAAELRQLAAGGIAIGAHTRTHPSLTTLETAAVADELRGSRADLERELGRPVTALSYPFGHHDEAVVDIARGVGFRTGVTTEPYLVTPADDPLRIPRIEIFGTDSQLRFLRKLITGGA